MALVIELDEERQIIRIEGEIEERELFETLRDEEQDTREEVLLGILKIGVAGYKRVKVGRELDFVEKKVEEMLSRLENTLNPQLETSYLGNFISRVKEYFDRGGKIEDILDPDTEKTPLGKFIKSLKDYFDSNGKLENLLNPDSETSPIGRFTKKLDEYLGRGGNLEKLLNPDEDGSPVCKLKMDILKEIKEIRDLIKEKAGREEIVERTPLKGRAFEEICEEVLNSCMEFGNHVMRTSDEVGRIPRCKKGDFVVEVDNGNKIVFEVKDWSSISLNKIKEEVREAIENRDANYGVFVSKNVESLPSGVGWFNEYGNILVCALGSAEADVKFPQILNVAYQWAKLKLKSNGELDTEALKNATIEIGKLNGQLEDFSKIASKCGSARKAIDEIEKIARNLENSLEFQLDNLKRAIGSICS